MSQKPHATIIADASFCHRTQTAGWGAWMIADGLRSLTTGGAMKTTMQSSQHAELAAIANAFHVANARGYLRDGETVLLQSDCQGALAAILYHVPGSHDHPAKDGIRVHPMRSAGTKRNRKVLQAVKGIVQARSLHLMVRHVKGHAEGEGRFYINRVCDDVAKSHMRAMRDAR